MLDVNDMHIQLKKVVLKEITHNDHAASIFTVNDINRLKKNIKLVKVFSLLIPLILMKCIHLLIWKK
jgi:hypothetical protein